MKDLVSSFLTTGGIQLANIITGVLAARLLLPEGRGELALLLLWPILIADLGSFALNASVGFHAARSDHSPKAIWASSVALITVVSPILMAVFILLSPLIFSGQRPEVLSLAWLCALLIPLHLYTISLISQFQGMQEFGAFNIVRALFHFCYLGYVCLLLLIAGTSLESFVYALIAANALPLCVAVWFGWRRGWVSLQPKLATVRALILYGLRTHLSVVLGVANRRLDQAIISIALAVTDLGLYVVAMTIQGLLILVSSTMDLLLFPKIAQQREEGGRQEVLGRYFRATLVLVVPPGVLLLAITPWLIETVFGAAFLPASDAARILILAALPLTVKTMLAAYMRGSNRMRIVTKSEGVGIVATAISLALLLPTLGLVGAAIAQVIAFTIPTAYMAFAIRATTGLSLTGLFRFERRDLLVFEDALARFRTREQG